MRLAPPRSRRPSRPFALPAVFALLALAACQGAPDEPKAPGAAAPVAPATPEASVKPGINEDFLDPDLDVAKFEQRFEGESREIFVHRARIAALVGLREGIDVADVGAGTGLFTVLFAPKVAPTGTVYAVDIAPKFVEHIEALGRQRGIDNMKPVVCSERSVDLPKDSVDLVFVCDTYHHFEYPQSTLRSIHEALRAGGELVVVDFIREPGVSREWILGHVRAGQAEVTREIEAAGFTFVRQDATPFLRENYLIRFRK